MGVVDCPELPVSIANHHVNALFDTGSRTTLISASFAKALKINNDAISPAPSTKLFSANLSPMNILYQARLRISLSNTTPPLSTFFDFLVVEGLDTDVILGTDFMASLGASINVSTKTIRLDPSKSFRPSKSWNFEMATHKSLKVNAKEEKVFLIRAPQINSRHAVLVEAVHPPHGFAVESGVVEPVKKNNLWHIPLIVANLTGSSAKIPRKTIVATITNHENFQVHPLNKTLTVKNKRVVVSDDQVLEGINLSTVPNTHVEKVKKLLIAFKDIFSSGPTDIGHCTSLPHSIRLKDPSKIVNIPPYRLPHNLLQVVHEYVDKLLEAGVIRHSTSPFSSPIMLVRKAGADPAGPLTSNYRVVHNYVRLNTNLDTCSYPLRHVQDLLDEVAAGKVRSIFDLSQGFFNQTLDDPQGATAFSVPGRGLFEYLRSPMGVASSPAYFQRLLDFVLSGLSKTWAYLDDVVIVADDWDEHLKQIEAAFLRFRKHNLKLNMKKVQLGKATVDFLGWTISNKEGIRPGERKTECIRKALPPRSVTEIRQYLGLAGFFRRAVPHFSQLASPLNALVRKGSGFTKGPLPPAARQAFEDIKAALTSRPCLAPVNHKAPFIVTVDSSMSGHGAVLSQIGKDGIERPVAYASATLSDPEKRKPAFQREKEGIRFALRKFQAYLHGAQKVIRSDHLPLKSLASGKVEVTDSVSADIMNFHPFTVEYLPGNKMPADYLSRMSAVNQVKISKATKGALKCIEQDEIQPIFLQSQGLKWSIELLLSEQQKDPECKSLFCYYKSRDFPIKKELRAFVMANRTCFKIDHMDGLIKDKQDRVFVPISLRHPLLEASHDSFGHRAAKAVLNLLCPHYVWPHMRSEIEDYIRACQVCSLSKSGPLTRLPLMPLPIAETFNARLHADALTNLPMSPVTGHRHVLVLVDAFSGFIMAKPLKTLQANEVLGVFMDDWLPAHGVPTAVTSDSGSEFSPKLVSEIEDKLQIQWHFSTPSHSQSNSPAERAIRSLVSFLRTYVRSLRINPAHWEDYLSSFCLVHNSLRNNRGFSPFELVQGLQPRLPFVSLASARLNYNEDPFIQKLNTLTRIAKIAKEKIALEQEHNKAFHDQHLRQPKFLPGSLAYVENKRGYTDKLSRPFIGPFLVAKVDHPYLLLQSLADPEAKPFKRHQNQCRLGYNQHAPDPIRLPVARRAAAAAKGAPPGASLAADDETVRRRKLEVRSALEESESGSESGSVGSSISSADSRSAAGSDDFLSASSFQEQPEEPPVPLQQPGQQSTGRAGPDPVQAGHGHDQQDLRGPRPSAPSSSFDAQGPGEPRGHDPGSNNVHVPAAPGCPDAHHNTRSRSKPLLPYQDYPGKGRGRL